MASLLCIWKDWGLSNFPMTRGEPRTSGTDGIRFIWMVQDPIFWTNVIQRHNHSFCGSENWLSFRRKLLNMSVRVNLDYIKLGRNTSDSGLGSYVGQKRYPSCGCNDQKSQTFCSQIIYSMMKCHNQNFR